MTILQSNAIAQFILMRHTEIKFKERGMSQLNLAFYVRTLLTGAIGTPKLNWLFVDDSFTNHS